MERKSPVLKHPAKCLVSLNGWNSKPARSSICDETGTMRRHVNLFVNSSHMRDRQGIDTPLAPGDEVTILPAVSGG